MRWMTLNVVITSILAPYFIMPKRLKTRKWTIFFFFCKDVYRCLCESEKKVDIIFYIFSSHNVMYYLSTVSISSYSVYFLCLYSFGARWCFQINWDLSCTFHGFTIIALLNLPAILRQHLLFFDKCIQRRKKKTKLFGSKRQFQLHVYILCTRN